MTPAHRRHDITDQIWERLQPHLPGGAGKRGRPARDNRLFLDAVFWNLRTGAPWRDLRKLQNSNKEKDALTVAPCQTRPNRRKKEQ